jgi:SAM-dependent methyltransferase
MGPGDSVGSAVAAKAMGFSAFYLVDAGDYANRDLEAYKEMSRICSRRGLASPDLGTANSLDDILAAQDATYLTNGLRSYQDIPTASVDFIFSQAVLEHVRRDEFAQIAAEMRRILKPDGVASHQVDLQDHLCGGLKYADCLQLVGRIDGSFRLLHQPDQILRDVRHIRASRICR